MKLQGILGGGTGKLGESVFTNNAGRTIVRQYNPHVRNPRTARQQNSRGRFTVASELAKQFALALKIGMPRIGALTSRNRFTSMIIPTSAGVINLSGDTLTPDYTKMPLSKGGMPKVGVSSVAVNSGSNAIDVTLAKVYAPEQAGYVAPMLGAAGIVCVLHNETTGDVRVLQALAGNSTTVSFPMADVASFAPSAAYLFAKWVPEAYNDIQAATLPWKFPSDQSETEYKSVS